MRKRSGFTLIELLAVIVIIGILATLGITHYAGMKEKALDKEAIANLKLIQAAEKIYNMETGSYIACATTTEVNTNLKLSIPTGNPNWNYLTKTTTGCAQATRNVSGGRTMRILITEEEPVSGSTCP